MPRYDDRHGNTRLYVGRLSTRTRSRDLDRLFSRYGRVRDVDMKNEFAFVEFSDPRDADDARYSLNGRDVDGARITVEFAKGVPRGPGGSRENMGGRGPPPGSGRCFNCGLDGHWARDCKAGDWKNKCYRCGERGHVERNCHNSPKKLSRGRSYSPSPVRSRSPRRGRSRSRSYSRGRRSYSRSKSPVKREQRERSVEHRGKRSRSPVRERKSSPPAKMRKHSPTPDEVSPQVVGSPSPDIRKSYSESPKEKSRRSPERDISAEPKTYQSPSEANGHSCSPSPRDDRSPIYDDEDDTTRHSPRASESPRSPVE